VAADALRRAGSMGREAVRDALAATDLKTPVTPVRFQDFDGFKNQNPIRSLVLQIQKGQHVTVFPAELSPAEVRHPTPPWSER
jgi:branched-chain amino acid transport system substrate-binding protein